MSKVVLIDGHSILNRAYYGIPLLSNAAGLHTNAIYGFLNILFKVMDEEKPDHLAVAFDVHAPTFRHEIYKEYKGNRHPMPDELREQVPVLKELLGAMQIFTIEKAGYEADDILGTLCRIYEERGEDVSLISGDRDMLQLATQRVRIRIPKTKMNGTEVEDYYAEDVKKKYNVTPSEFIDMKALMGDSSDNIPGVPGIGEKTASRIIESWHDIESAYEHVSEIKPKKASENLAQYYEQAKFAKVLVTIKTDCDLDFDPESTVIRDLMNEQSYAMLKKLELKNILSRFAELPSDDGAFCDPACVITELSVIGELPKLVDSETVLGMFYANEGGFEGLAFSGINARKLSGAGVSVPASEADPVPACFIPAAGDVTPGILKAAAEEMVRSAKSTWFDDLKPQLDRIELNDSDRAYDASIAAYLLNPTADDYHYDDIAQNYISETVPSRADLLKKLSFSEAWENERGKLLRFLACQAQIPRRASDTLLRQLEADGMLKLFYDMEMPVLYVLHDMESSGIRVEKNELKDYGDRLSKKIDELEQDIYDLAGEIFNINSPRQLGVILFEKMNLPFAKKTKTGYSTSADILEKLEGKDPIIGKILEYRQLTKLKSTYADGLASFIRPEDQRIHCNFKQTITATGRLSCVDPNLQNIPVRVELGRLIRKVFVPDEGKLFINADYSQIELRILAHMAGDENLIEAYRQDRDIHRITASEVFHVPFDEVTPAQRRSAKAVNFGIVYGISSFGLSQDLGIGRREAEEYIKQYFKTYPGIREFLDRSVAQAKEKGYSLTMFGRRRPVPELSSKNFAQRNFGERVAMNSPIQGTAADIIKIAMVNVDRRLKKENMKSKLILQIHDELLTEAVPEEADEVKRILDEEMCSAAELAVPLVVEMNSGYNWYELK